MEEEVPASYYCPITHELMKEPMIDNEGNSYEKNAIHDWLSRSPTSPVTRSPLLITDLRPNRALRDAIDEWRNKQKGPSKVEMKTSPKEPTLEQKAPTDSKSEPVITSDAGDEATVTFCTQKSEAVVSVKSPSCNIADRPACDLVCVVDISGSMGEEALLMTGGGKEGHGLSQLDLVKHAVKTIIHSLKPQDRLSVVTYHTIGEVVFGLLSMNEAGKKRALTEVEALTEQGSTNMWDGLLKGLDVLKQEVSLSRSTGRNSAVLLLTDGQPNINPPRGTVEMLKRYLAENKLLSCSVNTFGFGYHLDSVQLKDIAVVGKGMYSFIPDGTFVGTVFVNAISNILATMGKHAQIIIRPIDGTKIVLVLGDHSHQTDSSGVTTVDIGSLQYAQTKDVVISIDTPKEKKKQPISVTLNYQRTFPHKNCIVEGVYVDNSNEVEVQKLRLTTIDRISEAMSLMKDGKPAKPLIATSITDIKSSVARNDERVVALLKDLEGQVTEAFSRKDWFDKWGVHYLPSLMRAHLLQLCNNFKDPGVQVYGGKVFNQLRDEADSIFCKLPPPKPSRTPSSGTTVQSMSVYNNSCNPCFDGNALVLMDNGTLKKVKLICKGDRVMSPYGATEVVCVVKTNCYQGKAELVELNGGLVITPWHPVKIQGKWKFPADLGQVVERSCPAVYSFVLKDKHVMLINGIQCVTLGHDFEEEGVKHPYFGSDLVIKDLQCMHGWRSGLVELNSGCLVLDVDTKLVCGLRSDKPNRPVDVAA